MISISRLNEQVLSTFGEASLCRSFPSPSDDSNFHSSPVIRFFSVGRIAQFQSAANLSPFQLSQHPRNTDSTRVPVSTISTPYNL